MRILVTGGAGFIGSALVRHLLRETDHEVLNLDKLTYAGNLESLAEVEGHARYRFEKVDICDAAAVREAFRVFQPEAVMHLAAESHVDRSIDGPAAFVQTNVVGTYTLLEAARAHLAGLADTDRQRFRFLHVSTDEVFGSLGAEGAFTETTPYDPSSPYSATKAASDHLARAWGRTFGLPVLVTNCSNNYGPYQYPEKLVPVAVNRALRGETIPVYGTGENVRDWLFVDDHARALVRVLEAGRPGETYNVGGRAERTNLQVVEAICDVLDELRPGAAPHRRLVSFVTDRPGHDFRYAIDPSKIAGELGWEPQETFESGLARTVRWYADHAGWCERAIAGRYDLGRLGTASGTASASGTTA